MPFVISQALVETGPGMFVNWGLGGVWAESRQFTKNRKNIG